MMSLAAGHHSPVISPPKYRMRITPHAVLVTACRIAGGIDAQRRSASSSTVDSNQSVLFFKDMQTELIAG
jgi:hypothetical protein